MNLLLKSEIRVKMQHARQMLSLTYRKQASLAAAQHFVQSPFFKKYGLIASYMPVREELDPHAIIAALWQNGKQCYLPLISQSTKTLQFAAYHPEDPLQPNRYGILEPQNLKFLVPTALEVVLLPLLAFDQKGNRLGSGGGYYDRTFSFIRDQNAARSQQPILLGLAYAQQEVFELPRENFDLALAGVITEEKITLFKHN